MEPNFKLLLDEMASLNRRFDAHDDRWNRRFSDLERGLTDRITALEESLTTNSDDLARRVATLEADPSAPATSAVVSRLATLEASYADRDAEFTQRLSHLESLRSGHVDRDERVNQLEAATADLASWRPSVDDVLDDVRLAVKKLEKTRDRDVFDAMSHGPGLLPTPTKALASSRDRDVFDAMSHKPGSHSSPTTAAVHVSAGLTANPPVMGTTSTRLHGIQDPGSSRPGSLSWPMVCCRTLHRMFFNLLSVLLTHLIHLVLPITQP
jgi:hypothetical protein